MRRLFLVTAVVSLLQITQAWAQEGKISGRVYFGYTLDMDEYSDGENSFEVQRVYFTYKKSISENMKIKVNTDVGRLTDGSRLSVYLKHSYLDWTIGKSRITIGMQPMNVFGTQEKTWGYRFLYKSAFDGFKWVSSADIGLGYHTRIGENLRFSLLITNGVGYKYPEDDKYKRFSIALRFGENNLLKKDGVNAGTVLIYEPSEDTYSHDTDHWTAVGFYGGFAFNGLRMGGEINLSRHSEPDFGQQIYSAYGNYRISQLVEGFARMDYYNPDDGEDGNEQTLIIAGFNFTAEKVLNIAPNILYRTFRPGDESLYFRINLQYNF